MTLFELQHRAEDAVKNGSGYLTLILPAKRPKGFPRGELMCEGHEGKVYSIEARKVLKWLHDNFDGYGYETTGNTEPK